MKYVAFILIGFIVSLSAVAQDRGIGVSIQGDRTLFMTFDIDSKLRLEPSIYYNNSMASGEFATEHEAIELLLGVFNKSEVSDQTNYYYGSRLGYAAKKDRYKTSYSDDKKTYEGYKVSSVIGVEYYFIENLSLSGDISINYRNLNGNAVTIEEISTDSGLSVRFYF